MKTKREEAVAPPSYLAVLTALAVKRTSPRRTKTIAVVAVLALLLGAAAAIVFATGGTRYAYAHVTYVPIIAAAFFFGLRGGLAAGIVAGLVMGPFMPLDVQAWTLQGTENWLTRTGFFVLVGSLSGLASDSLRRQLQTIRRNVHYDRRTALPNRALCVERLTALIADCGSSSITALSVGIGGFEGVIAALGHDYADKLHEAAARRLRLLLPEDIELYSFGSGLFVALFAEPAQEARDQALRLAQALDERFDIGGVPVLSAGHAGLARSETEGGDASSLLRGCISAFRDAELARQHVSYFSGHSDGIRQSKLRLLPELQAAISTRAGLSLHFQPIFDVRTGHCHAAEALIRWTHPDLGPLPPSEFIAAAEQTALIRSLTKLVLELALEQLREWQPQGIDLHLSVNLSVRDIEDHTFPCAVFELLDRFGVHPSHLTLEITETALMTSAHAALQTLSALRAGGISIALDDFGVGQSSLSYLSTLPADVLKLDRAFARDLESNPRAAVVVKAAIEAAHALGQKVVAEGIESQKVLDALREISCDFGQGYLLARPLPEQQFRSWLQDHQLQVAQSERILSAGIASERHYLVATSG